MKCSTCGAELNDFSGFCGKCGTKTGPKEYQDTSKTKYRSIYSPGTSNIDLSKKNSIEYDVSDVFQKLKNEVIYPQDVNMNIVPELFTYYHDSFVRSGRINSKIRDDQLVDTCLTWLNFFNDHKIGNPQTSENISNKLAEKKKLDEDEFTYLVNRTMDTIQLYKDKTRVIDLLFSKNIGNEDILKRAKTIIDNGHFLNEKEYRYYLFCSLEFEKENIFNSGEVPIGWLPSDTNDLVTALETELNASKKKQGNINMLFAVGHLAGMYNDFR